MVTSNSGIADVCAPSGGAVNASRRDGQPQSSSNSFGDALKGQMSKTGGDQHPAPKAAPGEGGANTSNGSQCTDNSTKSGGSAQQAATKDGSKADQGSGKKATSRAKKNDKSDSATDARGSVLPSASSDTAATALGDTGAPPGQGSGANVANNGKKLPPGSALEVGDPQGSGTVPSAAQVPDWLQSMGMLSPGSGASSSNGVNADDEQGGTSGATTALQGTASDGNSLLKELQAMVGGAAGKDGKNSDAPADQNANPDALLKLIGDAGSKNASALSQPQAAGAAATGASNALLSTPPSGPAATTPTQLAVGVPVNQQGWDQSVSERVVWLAKQGIQEASIQLHPKNMGPIEVHIALHKDDASIAFVVHHPATREAIQAAMPKLRDMMQQSGLNLAQSDVSHQSFSQQHQGRSSSHTILGGQGSPLDGVGATASSGEMSLHSGVLLGAVDYYA